MKSCSTGWALSHHDTIPCRRHMTGGDEAGPQAEALQRGSRGRRQRLDDPRRARRAADRRSRPAIPASPGRSAAADPAGPPPITSTSTEPGASLLGHSVLSTRTLRHGGSRSVSTNSSPAAVMRRLTIPRRLHPSIMSRSPSSSTPVIPRAQSMNTVGLAFGPHVIGPLGRPPADEARPLPRARVEVGLPGQGVARRDLARLRARSRPSGTARRRSRVLHDPARLRCRGRTRHRSIPAGAVRSRASGSNSTGGGASRSPMKSPAAHCFRNVYCDRVTGKHVVDRCVSSCSRGIQRRAFGSAGFGHRGLRRIAQPFEHDGRFRRRIGRDRRARVQSNAKLPGRLPEWPPTAKRLTH